MDFTALLKFLKQLKNNNNKEWFDANRKDYERLRKEWIAFIDELLSGITSFDAGFAGVQAKDCIFRINKDIRFSKDKSPYKTNFGASMNIGGKKEFMGGYYFHVAPDEIFVAGGAYMPSPEHLAAIRQEIDYNAAEFKEIVENARVKKLFGKLSGESLTRPPKGYEDSNPMIGYLKMKSFLFTRNKTAEDLISPKIASTIVSDFKAMNELNLFIRRCGV